MYALEVIRLLQENLQTKGFMMLDTELQILIAK